MACSCGFSTDYPNCNGTHKVVKTIKTKLLQEVNAIDLGAADNEALNAVGMKALVLKIIAEL